MRSIVKNKTLFQKESDLYEGSMKKQKDQSPNKDHQFDNFVIQSKKFLQNLPTFKDTNIKAGNSINQFTINGVDYFVNRRVLMQQAEVLEDCCAVRGDNFYLKQGQIITIAATVLQQYAEIHFQSFCGYFPKFFFRIIPQYQ